MKKLAVFAVAAVFAASAMAGGIFDGDAASTITIGGKVFDITEFSTEGGDSSYDLGVLSDLTISSIAFNAWSDTWDNSAPTGGNVYLQLWGGNASSLDNGGLYDQWMDGATVSHLGDGHDYRLEYNTAFNPNTDASTTQSPAWNVELQENQTYYMDVYFKAYGGSADVMLPDGASPDGSGAKYHTTFTYQAPAVPEPATMSLLGLGALAMVLRRKLRK